MASALAEAHHLPHQPPLTTVVTGQWPPGDARHFVASLRLVVDLLGLEAEVPFAVGMAVSAGAQLPRRRSATHAQPAACERSAVLGVVVIRSPSLVPRIALVAVAGDAARVTKEACQVKQVPGHERDVPVREVVRRSA